MSQKLDTLLVWHRANTLWKLVNDVLNRPGFERDSKLQAQIHDAIDSIVSNIAEGNEQPTDRGFASYLYHSKASNAEARKRLRLACTRAVITEQEFRMRDDASDELARMLTGLIKHLHRSDFKHRGLGADRGPIEDSRASRKRSRPDG